MKIYLDNCCFNRPFDDQTSIRIKLESEAKLYIQDKIKNNDFELVWSFILDYENFENPSIDRKEQIQCWKYIASMDIRATEEIRQKASMLSKEFGIHSSDALHLACAIVANCDYILTVDDKFLKKTKSTDKIKVCTPIEFVQNIEEQII